MKAKGNSGSELATQRGTVTRPYRPSRRACPHQEGGCWKPLRVENAAQRSIRSAVESRLSQQGKHNEDREPLARARTRLQLPLNSICNLIEAVRTSREDLVT